MWVCGVTSGIMDAVSTSTTGAETVALGDDQVEAERVFSKSILVSAIRCTLTYVIIPFVAPLIGFISDVGPIIGIIIGTIALVANVVSIRRFWKADHKYKKHVTVLHIGVMILLVMLLVRDFGQL